MNTILGTTASSQSKFVTRISYASWFNGTNLDNYGGLLDKLTESDWGVYGIDAIRLYFDSITINGVYFNAEYSSIFYAENYTAYNYRNDGYGLGFTSYIDQLNIIMQNYQLRTRFYPAAGNTIVGIINTAENFEVYLPEFAGGIDVQTDYKIKCVYGEVNDTIFGDYSEVESSWA